MSGPDLTNDGEHFAETHRRWRAHLNRDTTAPGYRYEWNFEQCGQCRYWIQLAGAFKDDYGGCTNGRSPFDRSVMFEHDGCDEFEAIEKDDT
jgi:hypothetical protein